MSRPGRGKLTVIQPDDQVVCPLLRAGTMLARTCAERQHARATGSPRGARYYPCSYLIHGERKREVVFRCEVGKERLYRMTKEWWPENWVPKKSNPKLVAQHNAAKRRWFSTRLHYDRIDGRSV